MRTPTIILAVTLLAAPLPGCIDGFNDPLAVEGVEADVPGWFQHPDEASTLLVREKRERAKVLEDIRRMAVAGLLTADDTERLYVMNSQEWMRLYIEVLKGPNGPAYLAELRRTPDPTPEEWSDVISAVAVAEIDVERNAIFLATGEWPPFTNLLPHATGNMAPPGAASSQCGDPEEVQGTLVGTVALYHTDPYQGQMLIYAGGEQEIAGAQVAQHDMKLTVGSAEHPTDPTLALVFQSVKPFDGWSVCAQSYRAIHSDRNPKVPHGKCKWICPYAESEHKAINFLGALPTVYDNKGRARCIFVCGHDGRPGIYTDNPR